MITERRGEKLFQAEGTAWTKALWWKGAGCGQGIDVKKKKKIRAPRTQEQRAIR